MLISGLLIAQAVLGAASSLPGVKWAQNSDKIFVRVNAHCLKGTAASLVTVEEFSFACTSSVTARAVELKFRLREDVSIAAAAASVGEQGNGQGLAHVCREERDGKRHTCTLAKNSTGHYWDRLEDGHTLDGVLKIDWSLWVDEPERRERRRMPGADGEGEPGSDGEDTWASVYSDEDGDEPTTADAVPVLSDAAVEALLRPAGAPVRYGDVVAVDVGLPWCTECARTSYQFIAIARAIERERRAGQIVPNSPATRLHFGRIDALLDRSFARDIGPRCVHRECDLYLFRAREGDDGVAQAVRLRAPAKTEELRRTLLRFATPLVATVASAAELDAIRAMKVTALLVRPAGVSCAAETAALRVAAKKLRASGNPRIAAIAFALGAEGVAATALLGAALAESGGAQASSGACALALLRPTPIELAASSEEGAKSALGEAEPISWCESRSASDATTTRKRTVLTDGASIERWVTLWSLPLLDDYVYGQRELFSKEHLDVAVLSIWWDDTAGSKTKLGRAQRSKDGSSDSPAARKAALSPYVALARSLRGRAAVVAHARSKYSFQLEDYGLGDGEQDEQYPAVGLSFDFENDFAPKFGFSGGGEVAGVEGDEEGVTALSEWVERALDGKVLPSIKSLPAVAALPAGCVQLLVATQMRDFARDDAEAAARAAAELLGDSVDVGADILVIAHKPWGAALADGMAIASAVANSTAEVREIAVASFDTSNNLVVMDGHYARHFPKLGKWDPEPTFFLLRHRYSPSVRGVEESEMTTTTKKTKTKTKKKAWVLRYKEKKSVAKKSVATRAKKLAKWLKSKSAAMRTEGAIASVKAGLKRVVAAEVAAAAVAAEEEAAAAAAANLTNASGTGNATDGVDVREGLAAAEEGEGEKEL